jgi:hypothetical protein
MKAVLRAVLAAVLCNLVLCCASANADTVKASSQAKTVALVFSPQTPAYRIQVGSFDSASLGWLTKAVLAGHLDEKSATFTQKIVSDQPHADLQQEFIDELAGALKQEGLAVHVFAVKRDKDYRPDLSTFDAAKFDVVVDIGGVFSGYFADGPTTPYRRRIITPVSLYAPAGKSPVFQHDVDIQASRLVHQFEYRGFDQLMANSGAAYAGLRDMLHDTVVPSVVYTLRAGMAGEAGRSPFAGFDGIPHSLAAYKLEAGIGDQVWMELEKFRPAPTAAAEHRVPKRLGYESTTVIASRPNDPIKSSVVVNFEALGNGFFIAKSDLDSAKSKSRHSRLSFLNLFEAAGVGESDLKVSVPFNEFHVKTFERARITGIKLPASFEEAVKPGGGWSYEVTTAKESVTETKGDIRATIPKESTIKVTCANDAALPASQLLPHLTGNMIRVHCSATGEEDGSGSDFAYFEDLGVFIALGNKTKTLSTTMTIQKLE